jgi:preprotein translocase subunit YajC
VDHLLSLTTTLLAATTTTKKSSSSATFLIFIVIVVGALYFLFLRPNQQKAKKARQDNSSIAVGDRVVTIGGIVGRIEELQNDRVVLLTGNASADADVDEQPTRLVMLRTAIARKMVDPTPMPEVDDDEDDDEHDHVESDDASDTGKAEGETGA